MFNAEPQIELLKTILAVEVEAALGSCDGVNITVRQCQGNPRHVEFHIDVLEPIGDGIERAYNIYRTYNNAVHITDSEEMLRYRVRAAFEYPIDVSLYSFHAVDVKDCKSESPP